MIADLSAVLWKETRTLLHPGSSRVRMAFGSLAPVILLAILLPILVRNEWLTTGWPLAAAAAIPLVEVGIMIPGAIAGERERHTLETLLASRVSDRAILLGKLGVSIACGVGGTAVVLLISLVTVNMLAWEGRVLFYRPILALAEFAASLLMSTLVASLGVLISLRAATVQDARQTLSRVLLVPMGFLLVAYVLLMSAIPGGNATLAQIVARAGTPQGMGAALAAWAILDAALLASAMARFRRAHLILS